MPRSRPPRRLRMLTQYGILLLMYAFSTLLAATVLSLFIDDPNQYIGLGLLGGGILLAAVLHFLRGRGGPA